jgi:hypothetical protein
MPEWSLLPLGPKASHISALSVYLKEGRSLWQMGFPKIEVASKISKKFYMKFIVETA